jgi:hypothetical protein
LKGKLGQEITIFDNFSVFDYTVLCRLKSSGIGRVGDCGAAKGGKDSSFPKGRLLVWEVFPFLLIHFNAHFLRMNFA